MLVPFSIFGLLGLPDCPTSSDRVRVSLNSGDGDVSTTADCSSDIKFFCKTTKPGEGRIAACLGNQLDQEENGAVTGRKISAQCTEELRAFKIDRFDNRPHHIAAEALTRIVQCDDSIRSPVRYL